MATAREIDPFLKVDLPTRAPKRHGQSLPRRALEFPPYDMGAKPHMAYRLTRRRSVQLPRGYVPLRFRGNQRSGRRTTAQKACNRPTVKGPFIFAVTSGQKGEPPWKKRIAAPRLCAPSASLQPAVQHGGPGPHVIQPARRLPGAKKSRCRSRQCHVFSGPSRKTEKISFQNQCSDSRHPVHGPTVTLSTMVTGQSAVGIGVAVGMTTGGPAVITSTGAQEQQDNRQSVSGPTCRLASSPEASPGATVGTLNQGYPLLEYEGVVHEQRLRETQRMTPDPTTWAGLKAHIAKKDNTPQDASLDPDPHRGTPDPCACKSGTPKKACRVPRMGTGSL
jgi:hypothetical protein